VRPTAGICDRKKIRAGRLDTRTSADGQTVEVAQEGSALRDDRAFNGRRTHPSLRGVRQRCPHYTLCGGQALIGLRTHRAKGYPVRECGRLGKEACALLSLDDNFHEVATFDLTQAGNNP
jgi:hypothetical protein